MQTYRRLATTASSTSRSASSTMHHHQHPHPHPAAVSVSSHSHSHSRLSRSSSSTSSAVSPSSMTPVDSSLSLAVGSYGRMGGLRNSSYASNTGTTSDYTRAELETIAESLLAHVTFGPYHLASSPVPSSHLRLAMSSKENNASSNLSMSTTVAITDASDSISATPTLTQLGSYVARPSARRHFEGKEGSERNHHPRARFTIGGGGDRGGESERGRGMARKSVGLSIRDMNGDSFEFERGREMRGRRGSVKELQ